MKTVENHKKTKKNAKTTFSDSSSQKYWDILFVIFQKRQTVNAL